MRSEARWAFIFALPALIGFAVWVAGPLLASFVISLSDWRVGASLHIAGFQNYARMLSSDKLFPKSLLATTYFSFTSVPLTILVSFAVAVLLNQRIVGVAAFRTLLYLPSIVPSVASAMLWLWLFNPNFGLLNYLLSIVGLPKLLWLRDEVQVIPSLVLMSIWRMGGSMVIFIAALQGVPQSLYEAVEIDGGGAWRKLVHVTIPLMTPALFFNFIIGFINSFQLFTRPYIMTEGGPDNASLSLVYYVFLNGFRYGRMGYASSLAWTLFVVILVLTLLFFRFSRSLVYYETKDR